MSGLGEIQEQTITIASGSASSGSLLMGQYDRGSYQVPAAMTGTTVTVQFSNDGTNWTAVPAGTDDTNPETFSANATFPIPRVASYAKFQRFLSNQTEAAARTITVFLRA